MTARRTDVFVWHDKALYVGGRLETGLQSHYGVKLAVALDGSMNLALPGGERLQRAPAVIVGPHTLHELEMRCERVAIIHAGSLTPFGKGLRGALRGHRVMQLSDARAARWGAELAELSGSTETSAPEEVCLRLLAELDPCRLPTADPRIDRATHMIMKTHDRKVPVRRFAEAVGLSESRFCHLFRKQTGMPVRSYRRWVRLGTALVRALGGLSFTQSALEAGFSDTSHFSRSCRQTFGLAPSSLRSANLVLREPDEWRDRRGLVAF